MPAAGELADHVRRALEDQPYTVVDQTPSGFSVHVDVVDAQWWTLLHRAGVRRTWRWDVKVRDDGTYTVTDKPVDVQWQAGLDSSGGVPRPTLRFRAGFFQGTAVSVQKRTVWAVGDDGRFGPVVDYRFDSREGRDVIDAVAEQHGLTKKMNVQARIGLYVALLALVGTALGGLWALALALTGNLP